MLKEVPISQRTAQLLVAAQNAQEKAQRDLDVIVQTVLAGLDIVGQVTQVDAQKNVLHIEIPDAPESEA